ncbi:hypothetical protein JHK85_016965 [Glycine max]|nr:hypothetical protein JHK85_016965 [Glycine max]
MKGTKKYHRVGPWNGLCFSGGRPKTNNPIYHYEFVSNKEEILENHGCFIQQGPKTTVTIMGFVEAMRIAALLHHQCECLKGFKPKSPEKLNSMDWFQGCVLKHPLSCKYDGFAPVDGLKVPDTKRTYVDETIDLEQCRRRCLKDCSCCIVDDGYFELGFFSPKVAWSEVVTGVVVVLGVVVMVKKNMGSGRKDDAWTLWKEHNALQLIDSSIKDSSVIPEVLRCIHVSLLCVQQYPEDRPTMTSVIQMLGGCEMDVVVPKEPGFFPRQILKERNQGTNLKQMTSNDELTVTSLSGR